MALPLLAAPAAKKLTVDTAVKILGVITDIFKKRPSPNDWKGWEKQDKERGSAVGVSAQHWTLNDGDSIPNEALNILSWMKHYGVDTVIGYDSWHKKNVTKKDIADKLRRGGFHAEAEGFDNIQQTEIKTAPVSSFFGNIETSIFKPTPLQQVNQQIQPQKMGNNIMITIVIILAAIAFGSKYLFNAKPRKW